ncbi:MAG: sugar transferase [Clostridia bacterium]|nr:sugar transferase [Clostridia bacterium]
MYRKYIKRVFDVILALLGMPLLLIILIMFAPIIYLTDKGPIFYNAPRLGKNGKTFKMFKFRSMYINAPDIRMEDGSTFNAEDDPRVTPIGRFLRKTSIDEAPQIINILLGDMSVIGPRPDLPEHMKMYEGNESEKLKVRPGITGYNQAYYRNTIEWRVRLQHDVYYVDNITFILDAKIFIHTAFTVLTRRNVFVSQPNDDCQKKSDSTFNCN